MRYYLQTGFDYKPYAYAKRTLGIGKLSENCQHVGGVPITSGASGSPTLAVDFIIGLMADGWNETDILRNYPGLSHDDLAACLAYARDVLRSEKVYPSAA